MKPLKVLQDFLSSTNTGNVEHSVMPTPVQDFPQPPIRPPETAQTSADSPAGVASQSRTPSVLAEARFLRDYLCHCFDTTSFLPIPVLFPSDYELDPHGSGAVIRIKTPTFIFALRYSAQVVARVSVTVLLPLFRLGRSIFSGLAVARKGTAPAPTSSGPGASAARAVDQANPTSAYFGSTPRDGGFDVRPAEAEVERTIRGCAPSAYHHHYHHHYHQIVAPGSPILLDDENASRCSSTPSEAITSPCGSDRTLFSVGDDSTLYDAANIGDFARPGFVLPRVVRTVTVVTTYTTAPASATEVGVGRGKGFGVSMDPEWEAYRIQGGGIPEHVLLEGFVAKREGRGAPRQMEGEFNDLDLW
ncbi:hypothetical protein HK101_001781 [Irineochytrium annulatum]|nr:hypothetical protein HK101_001781 [Irineochytrium annulatum]